MKLFTHGAFHRGSLTTQPQKLKTLAYQKYYCKFMVKLMETKNKNSFDMMALATITRFWHVIFSIRSY